MGNSPESFWPVNNPVDTSKSVVIFVPVEVDDTLSEPFRGVVGLGNVMIKTPWKKPYKFMFQNIDYFIRFLIKYWSSGGNTSLTSTRQ